MSGPLGSSQWMYGAFALTGDRDDDYYDYEIAKSCCFNDGDNANMTNSFSTGNRQVWSYSAWVKFRPESGTQRLMRTTAQGGWGVESTFMLYSDGTIDLLFDYNGGNRYRLITSSKHRDPAAWYHILIVAETTNGTTNNRLRIYVNGERETSFSTRNMPSQNFNGGINYAATHGLGDDTGYLDAYLADVHFIDGTALPAAAFGEYGDYGDWVPIAYNTANGGYGTNGFHLNFADANDLGKDVSGQGNHWTENNVAAHDQMIDTPTNNFATFNPLTRRNSITTALTYTECMRKVVYPTEGGNVTFAVSTMGVTTGQWYCEILIVAQEANAFSLGIANHLQWTGDGNLNTFLAYRYNGEIKKYTNVESTQASYTDGDIIGIAFDIDNEKISFYKNGSLQATISGSWVTYQDRYFVLCQGKATDSLMANFGQDSSFGGAKTAQSNQDSNDKGDFYYEPPEGYLAMCTNNIVKPAVVPEDHFNIVTWTGNNGSDHAITGVGFQPDLVWAKSRPANSGQDWVDAVRGVSKNIKSNANTAEQSVDTVKAFGADGFTVGSGNGYDINKNGEAIIGYCWKANGSGSSNTNGSINTTGTSANADAGFSISVYTGNNTSGATVGHGLSKAPEFILIKQRPNARNWWVYHKGAKEDAEDWYQNFNLNGIWYDNVVGWNDTVPGASVFTIGNEYDVNGNSQSHVAYCWHSVEGYSSFGHYFGNGSTDGTFVNCGFRPRFVMCKRVASAHDWVYVDTKRDEFTNDGTMYLLNANESGAEDTDPCMDIVSNGFKIRDTALRYNSDDERYVFVAFAETPFKYANAR